MTSRQAKAARKRAARARRKSHRFLYHGTSGALAGVVSENGLTPGSDGRVWVTDSVTIARVYATWGAVAQHIAGGEPEGAVIEVRAPRDALTPVDEFAPPLPWQATSADGGSYYIAQPVAAQDVVRVAPWTPGELRNPEHLAAAVEDTDRIARAFPRAGGKGPLAQVVPDPTGLFNTLIDTSPGAASPWHGAEHWLQVAAMGMRLLRAGCEADPAVVLLFALLHDSQRHAEGRDIEHGARAAAMARTLNGEWFELEDDRLAVLCDALERHDHGDITDDVTVGACWDSDRLTLPRLGISPDPDLLSTGEARTLAPRAARLISRPVDWRVLAFRYSLAAASAYGTFARA